MSVNRRPPSSGLRVGGRLPTGGPARLPYRVPTGANPMQLPGTGRPGSRAGLAGTTGALSSQIKVADRPVTQQGLGGMATGGGRGPLRQVQDRSYYLGLIRAKTQELNTEIQKLNKEIDVYNQENVTYLSHEKKAETLAAEIKELQSEMADYNTLMDRINTDSDVSAIMADCTALQRQNDKESQNIDVLFAERQAREEDIKRLEREIEDEKKVSESVISSMSPETLRKFQQLKAENAAIEKDLEEKEEALERLNKKVQELQSEVSTSEIKQEALRLYQQLAEAIERRREWREKDKESPQEEKDRLLQQIKADNQEIASLERKCSELQVKQAAINDQIRQAESDLEEMHGERSSKYRELKQREVAMKEFLGSFDENMASEKEKLKSLEVDVVSILEHISKSTVESQHMPSVDQYEEMQADLAFKQEEMEKSEATAKSLKIENAKREMDLLKVEKLEEKISTELAQLKENIDTMTVEIEDYSDLQGLQNKEDEKRKLLEEQKEDFARKAETAKKRTQKLVEEYKAIKAELESNDTYTQLGNLERKWQHLEQNNFAMKDFIAAREMEGNYKQVAEEVAALMQDYNSLLCQEQTGPGSL